VIADQQFGIASNLAQNAWCDKGRLGVLAAATAVIKC
jgi:hypothetical protein